MITVPLGPRTVLPNITPRLLGSNYIMHPPPLRPPREGWGLSSWTVPLIGVLLQGRSSFVGRFVIPTNRICYVCLPLVCYRLFLFFHISCNSLFIISYCPFMYFRLSELSVVKFFINLSGLLLQKESCIVYSKVGISTMQN